MKLGCGLGWWHRSQPQILAIATQLRARVEVPKTEAFPPITVTPIGLLLTTLNLETNPTVSCTYSM